MRVSRSVDEVLQVGLACASQFCRQESPPAWSESGFSFFRYEPNDNFLTETYVEFNQESVTEQRFPEDLDYDDTARRSLMRAEDEPITLKEEACRLVCRRRQ